MGQKLNIETNDVRKHIENVAQSSIPIDANPSDARNYLSADALKSAEELQLSDSDIITIATTNQYLKRSDTTPEQKQKAIIGRNVVFKKMADRLAPESPGLFDIGGGYQMQPDEPTSKAAARWAKGLMNRIVANNTNQDDNDALALYYRKNGYDAKVENNKLYLKQEGDLKWKPFENESIDFFDMFDIFDDVAKGMASGFAATSKAGSLLLAPVTGGSSVIAASLLGGGAAGAIEAGQQTLAKLVGTRQAYDVERIGTTAAAEAIMPGLGFFGGKAVKYALKPKWQAIKQAAERLDVKAIPGMLADSPFIQKSTEYLYKTPYGYFNKTKDAIENIRVNINKKITDLVENKNTLSPLQIGTKAKEDIFKNLSTKIDAAEKLYDQWMIPAFNNARLNLKDIAAELETTIANTTGNPDARRMAQKYLKEINYMMEKGTGGASFEALKKMRTSIFNEMKDPNIPANRKEILPDILDMIKRKTDEKYNELMARAQLPKGDKNKIITSPETLAAAQAAKAEADKSWVSLAKDLAPVLKREGADIGGSLKQKLNAWYKNKNPQEIVDDVFNPSDMETTLAIKRIFPDLFEDIRQFKLNQMQDKWSKGAELDTKKAIADLDKLSKNSPEYLELLFPGQGQRVEDIVTVYSSVPKGLLNPPDTAVAKETVNFITGIMSGKPVLNMLHDFIVRSAVPNTDMGETFIANMMKTNRGKMLLGAAQTGALTAERQLLPTQPKDKQDVLYPSRPLIPQPRQDLEFIRTGIRR